MGKAKHPHDASRPESRAVVKALEANDMDMLRDALSFRQRRFCEEYVVDFNATAAGIRAGYSLNSVAQQGSLLLKNKGVETYCNHLTTSSAAKMVSVNPDYVIQQVTEIIGKAGTRDGDRLRGLELLARHLGMFIDRTEISGRDGEAIQIEKTQNDAADLESAIARLADRGGTSGVAPDTKH